MIRKSFLNPVRGLAFSLLLISNTLVVPSDATPISKPEPNRDQIKIIESELSREKQKYEEFNAQEKDLLTQLSYLEQEVNQKRRALEELKAKIHLTRSAIEELEKSLAGVGQSLKKVEFRLAKKLVALYKYTRRGYIEILANVNGPDEFLRRVKYAKSLMEEDQREMLRLAEEVRTRKKEVSDIREKLVEKEAISNKEQIQLSSLKEDLEKKVVRLMNIHREKEFYETAVQELQLAAEDLKQTLLNIEKREEYKISYPSNFPGSKGMLPLPLEGKVVRPDQLPGSTRFKLHKGIFIERSSERNVRAVFPGRVDFSGRLRGYGDIIIINHGSRFFTISAHLSHRKKEAGDLVEGGDIIGLVGGEESPVRSKLYFEIRKGGQNLNPLEWLKVH